MARLMVVLLAWLLVAGQAHAQGAPPASLLGGGATAVENNPGAGSEFLWTKLANRGFSEQTKLPLGDENRVLLHSGTFVHEVTDFRIPGRGLDVHFRRLYRTDSAVNGALGRGWQHNYDQYLVRGQPSTTQPQIQEIVAFNDGIGRGFAFKRVAGVWIAPKNVSAKLVQEADGTFRLTENDGTVRRFAAPTMTKVAHIQSLEDRKGNVITFSHNSQGRLETIVDTLGRSISFGYHPTGRIQSISDWTGRTWWYGYDANDDLVTVVTADPDDDPAAYGYTTTYTYDERHLMLSGTWPEGPRFSNTYDPEDYTLVGHSRGSGSWSFDSSVWSPVGAYIPPEAPAGYHAQSGAKLVVDVTDRNGNESQYFIGPSKTFLWVDRSTNRDINGEDPAAFRTYFEYVNSDDEASGKPSTYSVTEHDGRALVQKIDARDRTVQRAMYPGDLWDGEPPEITRFVYDDTFDLVTWEVGPEAFTDGVVPLEADFTLDLEDADVQKWATRHIYDYEEAALGDQNGDGITTQANGLIVKTIFPANVTFSEAFAGETLPQERVRTFKYNDYGQLLSSTDEAGTVTSYAYWPVSNPGGQGLVPTQAVSDVATPGGYLAVMVKDALPVGGDSPLQLTTVTRHDEQGNEVERIDPRGNVTRRQYDRLDRLVLEQRFAEDGVTELARVEMDYDGNGNVVARRESNLLPDGTPVLALPVITTLSQYDTEDLLLRIDEQVWTNKWVRTRYRYDKNGNLVLELRPRANDPLDPEYDPTDIVSRVYDERDLLHAETWGGLAPAFSTLAAHDHIDLVALDLAGPFPEASTEISTYGASGEVVHIVGAEGDDVVITLDGHGRPIAVTNDLGNSDLYSYDVRGRVTLIERRDAASVLLARAWRRYDQSGRLIEFERDLLQPGGETALTGMLYDARGQRVARKDWRGLRETWTFDRAGRLTSEVDTYGNALVYSHDPAGNRTSATSFEVGADPVTTLAEFDALNRRRRFTDADGGSVDFGFDSRGNVVRKVDQLGHVTSYVYDGRGGLIGEQRDIIPGGCQPYDPMDCATTLQYYDANGNLDGYLDGESKTHLFHANTLGRIDRNKIGSSVIRQATFWGDGNVHLVTDGNGTVIEHLYDNAGRIVSRLITPGPGVSDQTTQETFTWDAMDRMATAGNNGAGHSSIVSREYDAIHGVRVEALASGGLSFAVARELDGAGASLTQTYPAGTEVLYIFDSDSDAVEDITINGLPVFHYEYGGAGRVKFRDTFPGGAMSWRLERVYDAHQQVTLHDHVILSGGSAGNRIAGFDYTYDELHRRRSVLRLHESMGDQYTYDGLGQLTEVLYDVPGASLGDPQPAVFGSGATYSYDRAENRLLVDEGGLVTAYDINATDNAYTAVGGAPLTYDGNGNLVHDEMHDYVYDYANRLVEVRSHAGFVLVQFAYDALGRRIRKEVPGEYVRIDVWSGSRLVEQREDHDLDGTFERVRQLVYGPEIEDVIQLRVDGVPYFPITDALGSVVALADAMGTVVESYRYDAWGVPEILDHSSGSPQLVDSSPLGNPSLWAGRDWDPECELYYSRARFYSPRLGRFLTRDPIGLQGGRNLYAYTGNNPVHLTDPSGQQLPSRHYDYTYDAVFAAQLKGSLDYDAFSARDQAQASAKVAARASKDWDSKTIDGVYSQDKEAAHWHGMSNDEQKEFAFDKMWSLVQERLDAQDMQSLGEALHMIQDVVSGGHQLQDYDGTLWLVLKDALKTVIYAATLGLAPRPHWVDDAFPDKVTDTLIKGLSYMTASGDADLVKQALEVVLKLAAGAGGSMEVDKDGSIKITLPSGTVIIIDKDGGVTVTPPEEEDGDDDEEDEDSIEANDGEEDPDAGDGGGPMVRGPHVNPEGEVIPLDPADGR